MSLYRFSLQRNDQGAALEQQTSTYLHLIITDAVHPMSHMCAAPMRSYERLGASQTMVVI